jgi:hypothetical protein
METNQLQEILFDHKLWLENSEKGLRANLRDANLRDAINLFNTNGKWRCSKLQLIRKIN